MSYNNWSQKTDINDGFIRSQQLHFRIENIIYTCGGQKVLSNTSEVWAYNILTDTWTQKYTSYPLNNDSTVTNNLVINGKGYVLGANLTDGNKLYEYDPVGDTWTQRALYTGTSRRGMGAFVLNNNTSDNIYAGCGRAGSGPLTDWYEWDSINNQWNVKANGSMGIFPQCFVINNKGYKVGGQDTGASYSRATYEYDAVANTWATKTVHPLSTGIVIGGGCNTDTLGYTFGGQTNFGAITYTYTLYEYNASSNSWETRMDNPTIGRAKNVAVGYNKKVYAGFGSSSLGIISYFDDWWMWDGSPTAENGFGLARDRKYERKNSIRETV